MPTPTPPPESQGPKQPQQPAEPGKTAKPLDPSDSKDAFLLKSPFAKMFEQTGAKPTVKEMKGIIDGILKTVINQVKKQDAGWKKAMKKMKEAILGENG
ncbi:MAG: hypothetical protein P0S96_01695 [Simkaniaceae bacterium]|nr:hypothetical protein [Candidatus Sacchlamyda saccharinae]